MFQSLDLAKRYLAIKKKIILDKNNSPQDLNVVLKDLELLKYVTNPVKGNLSCESTLYLTNNFEKYNSHILKELGINRVVCMYSSSEQPTFNINVVDYCFVEELEEYFKFINDLKNKLDHKPQYKKNDSFRTPCAVWVYFGPAGKIIATHYEHDLPYFVTQDGSLFIKKDVLEALTKEMEEIESSSKDKITAYQELTNRWNKTAGRDSCFERLR